MLSQMPDSDSELALHLPSNSQKAETGLELGLSPNSQTAETSLEDCLQTSLLAAGAETELPNLQTAETGLEFRLSSRGAETELRPSPRMKLPRSG